MNKETIIPLKNIYIRAIEILQIFQLDYILQISFGVNSTIFNQQGFVEDG